MKTLKTIPIIILLILFSCEKDSIDREIEGEKPGDVTSDIATNDAKSALIIDGVPYFAGTGYSPTQDRLFKPAIDSFDIFESSNEIEESLKVEISMIHTNEDLETFVRKSVSSNFDFAFKMFSFGQNTRNSLEEKIRISKETVTLVARISVKRYRYLTDGYPLLTEEAQSLIDSGNISDFLKKHGPMYIESQTLGGDVYYIYSYNLSNIKRERRSEFADNLRFNLFGIFNLYSGSESLSTEQMEEINRSVEKFSVASNIIGYTPTLINDKDQFQAEVSKVQNYINQEPQKTSSMKKTLRPYSDFIDDEKVLALYNNEVKCYTDWEQWSMIRAKILFVFNNTSREDIRSNAGTALQMIDNEISKSLTCNGSSTPGMGLYDNITSSYEEEQRWLELQDSRVNVYKYIHPRGSTNFLWPHVDQGLRNLGYSEHLEFSWLSREFPGTIPVNFGHVLTHEYPFANGWPYYYMLPKYTTKLSRSFNGDGGDRPHNVIIGYVFEHRQPGTVPLYHSAVNGRYGYHITESPLQSGAWWFVGYVFPPK